MDNNEKSKSLLKNSDKIMLNKRKKNLIKTIKIRLPFPFYRHGSHYFHSKFVEEQLCLVYSRQ